MANVEIGRLILDMPGLDAADGRRLAAMVAEKLAEDATPGARSRERLSVSLAVSMGRGLDQIAALIAEEIHRQIIPGGSSNVR